MVIKSNFNLSNKLENKLNASFLYSTRDLFVHKILDLLLVLIVLDIEYEISN